MTISLSDYVKGLSPEIREAVMKGIHEAVHEKAFFSDDEKSGRRKMQEAQAEGAILAFLEAAVERGEACLGQLDNGYLWTTDEMQRVPRQPERALLLRLRSKP